MWRQKITGSLSKSLWPSYTAVTATASFASTSPCFLRMMCSRIHILNRGSYISELLGQMLDKVEICLGLYFFGFINETRSLTPASVQEETLMFSSLNVLDEAEYTFYTVFQDRQYKVTNLRAVFIHGCCFRCWTTRSKCLQTVSRVKIWCQNHLSVFVLFSKRRSRSEDI